MAKKDLKTQDIKEAQGIHNPLGKRLYNLKEAASYLGRSVWGMRELIWGRKIPVVRGAGSRKIFIDVLDLNRFIDRNKNMFS
jgi:hypothetical protein